MQHVRQWWGRLPISDSVRQQQAKFFQLVLVSWIALVSVGVLLSSLLSLGNTSSAPPPEELPPGRAIFLGLLLIAAIMLWLSLAIALALLRRGRFHGAVLAAVLGLLFGHSIATMGLGVADASVYVVYQIPIALAGLLGGRRLLVIVTGYSILYVVLVGILQTQNPPLAGFFSTPATAATSFSALNQPLGFFVGVTLLVSLLLDRCGDALRRALTVSLAREAELQAISESLEATVVARTAELSTALQDLRRQ